MNTDRKHDPEKVREYFKRLECYKNSQAKELLQDKLPPEIIDSDETLVLCRDSLKSSTNNIESLSLAITLLKSQFESLVDKLESLEQDLKSKSGLINKLSTSINLERQKSISRFDDTNTSKDDFHHTKSSPTKIFHAILSSIITDLKASNLFNPRAIRRLIPKFIFAYISILIAFAIGRNIILNYSQSSTFQIFCLLYLLLITTLIFTIGELSFKYVVQKYKELCCLSSSDLRRKKSSIDNYFYGDYEAIKLSEQDLNLRRLISEKDELDSHYEKTEEECRVNQLRIQQLQVEISKNRISNQNCEELIIQRISELIELRYQELNELQEDVRRWLNDGITRIIKRAMVNLNIPEMSDQNRSFTLKNTPLRLLTGIPSLDKNSNIISRTVESDSTRSLRTISENKTFIDKDDFLSGVMYGSSTNRIFGVYEFIVIFLCSNFLTYHKCYFDLVKNIAINEENCEYFYDSIVSVQVQHISSTGLSDNSAKNSLRRRLLITTSDGKVVCFNVLQDRIQHGLSMKLSEVDEAAAAIRKMLRQRRVDFVRIVDTNDS